MARREEAFAWFHLGHATRVALAGAAERCGAPAVAEAYDRWEKVQTGAAVAAVVAAVHRGMTESWGGGSLRGAAAAVEEGAGEAAVRQTGRAALASSSAVRLRLAEVEEVAGAERRESRAEWAGDPQQDAPCCCSRVGARTASWRR